MPADPPIYRVKVLEKALALLDLFGQGEGGGPITLSEVSQRLGISKPTAFRIASVLEQADWLERAPGGGGYRLGFQLHRLGALVEGTGELQRAARPALEQLTETCDETIHLVVLHRGEALYLDKIEGKRSVRVVSRVGMRLPAHCSGVGKVLLAHLAEGEVDAIVRQRGLPRFTAHTITDREALGAELRRIRERGYAVDDEEIEVGLKCVAAPIRAASGQVIAAVSISGPSTRFHGAELKKRVAEVLRAAERVSRALGGREPPLRSVRRSAAGGS